MEDTGSGRTDLRYRIENLVERVRGDWLDRLMEKIERPLYERLDRIYGNDQTGNPWPECVCNDARYEFGHMATCPASGKTADRPGRWDA